MVQPLWKTVRRFILKIELLYAPAIPFLGTYPDKTIIQKDTCTPMFIVALFTIAKTWNDLNVHQQMNDKDVVHIYNGILLSHNKEQNNAICSNTDATRDYPTE